MGRSVMVVVLMVSLSKFWACGRVGVRGRPPPCVEGLSSVSSALGSRAGAELPRPRCGRASAASAARPCTGRCGCRRPTGTRIGAPTRAAPTIVVPMSGTSRRAASSRSRRFALSKRSCAWSTYCSRLCGAGRSVRLRMASRLANSPSDMSPHAVGDGPESALGLLEAGILVDLADPAAWELEADVHRNRAGFGARMPRAASRASIGVANAPKCAHASRPTLRFIAFWPALTLIDRVGRREFSIVDGLELNVQLIGNEDVVGLVEVDDRQRSGRSRARRR